jgi:ubiquitin conjugation factor E4 B
MEKLSGPAKPKREQSTDGDSSVPVTASSPPSKSATPVAEPAKPKITIKPASTSSAGVENPFAKLTSRPSSSTAPVSAASEASLKRPRAESGEQNTTITPPRKTSTPAGSEDLETWEDRILGQIFRITLDPKADSSSHKSIYLPNLRKDLEDENAPLRLTQTDDRLSTAIMEAASTIPHNKSVLDYLLPCWKRVTKALKGLRGYANPKDEILKEARRLCMSNCIFAVTMPELFG